MKNIHVLPTDKTSRIYLIKSNNRLGITSNNPEFTENFGSGTQNQNIYIASDEVIKEGDWYWLEKIGRIGSESGVYKSSNVKVSKLNTLASNCQKIILTTNVDLIEHGVQAIDDEFLEWFVKNPSCDEVEIIKQHQYHSSKKFYIDADYVNCSEEQYESIKEEIPTCPLRILYKIIIPKEEPCDNCNSEVCCCIIRPQETLEEAVNKFKKTDVYINEIKQETLEEVAKRLFGGLETGIGAERRRIWINGAKWQQERSYSEEDMYEYAIFYKNKTINDKFNQPLSPKEWFEKFKK